jgi:hypothetical protein
MKNRISLQEINLPLETKIEKLILFSILFSVENRKFINRNQKLKIDFNFQFCISNTKLKIDHADRAQKLTQ